MEVVKYARKHPKETSREVAKVFNCGCTQIQTILKKRDEITEEFERNDTSLSRKRNRGTSNDDLNDAVSKWFKLARQRNIPVSGPMIQEEAKIIAAKLGDSEFKASNGWLESFKKRHNIKQFIVSGEAADISEDTVQSWHERIKHIMQGFKPEDVWNIDETGCFFRALPEKTLAEKHSECKGGKKAKERVTIAFIANAAGGKETPIVIGRATKPCCFKGIRNIKKPLGVSYFAQSKAWMTADIMQNILLHLNRRLIRTNRSILLLMDNATPHDPSFVGKFSNIKIVFLPANTTAKLQPLDAGIIKNFKVHYRKLLLRHVLSRMKDNSLSTADIIKSVDVLTAIRWTKLAWENVQSSTIVNCFKHCKAVPDVSTDTDEDPFAGLDQDSSELGELVSQIQGDISVEQFISADNVLSTCFTFDDPDRWREELRDEVCSEEYLPQAKKTAPTEKLNEDCSEQSSDEEDDEVVPVSTIKSYSEALSTANNLFLFLTANGEEQISEQLSTTIVAIEHAAVQSMRANKQTDLLQYFKQ